MSLAQPLAVMDHIGQTVLDFVVQFLKSRTAQPEKLLKPHVAQQVDVIHGEITVPADVATPVALLQDESTFARVNAAAALSTFEGHADRVTPVLASLLGDGDDNVRLTAAMSLRNVGPLAIKAVPGLVRILDDSNPQIRAAAATTLGGIGPAATKCLPALRQLGSDPDASVVAAASRAIRQIDESARSKTAEAIPASATE